MSPQQAPAQGNGRLERWPAALDIYGVRFLVLDKQQDRSLLNVTRARPGWTVDFEDSNSVVFARIQAPQGARTAVKQTGMIKT